MTLLVKPLKNAFQSLMKAMTRANQDLTDLEIRDACIQRFEYTYELSIKCMKRYMESENPDPENIDQMNYRDFLRLAAEIGLIKQVELWFTFRDARNKTSHAYDEQKAIEVFNIIPDFIIHVGYFLGKLEKRLNKQ
jgi:nucleotidyltransferase substrate binding protein (TIGR01987 family)